jgi:hypothetical protein
MAVTDVFTCPKCGQYQMPACVCALQEDLNNALDENRELRSYIGLVVQYMEAGVPYWYGDKGLKGMGQDLLIHNRRGKRCQQKNYIPLIINLMYGWNGT